MRQNSSRTKHAVGRGAAIIAAISIVTVLGIAAWQITPLIMRTESQSKLNLPPMNLTVVALNGTEINLDSTDIAELVGFSGPGGYKTSAGYIRGIGNYTGVRLTDLCQLVGGMTSKDSLRVTADDGYSMIFSYEQVNGRNYTAFDPVTGDEVAASEAFTPVLAYYKDGGNISSDDGPLRVAILGSEGLVTEGHNWIKYVVKLEIRPSLREWTLMLKGEMFENMTRGTFESGVNEQCHGTNWTDTNENVWTGIPLWLLVGRVDDSNQHEGKAFNRTLADLGYIVRVVAGDGYYKDFNSTRVKMNDNIMLANQLNGAVIPEPYWPLRLVGSDLSSGEMIRNVVEIQLIFEGS